MTQLTTGSTVPDFSLQDQNGDTVSLADFKGRKLLIYFYPKASTPGCTTQSCSVRDARQQLLDLGVACLGVSPDAPDAQKKFETSQQLNFPLLCDQDHQVAEAYGVWGEKSMYGKKYMGIIRSSFLIDGNGKLIQAWYKVSPADTVPLALAEIARLS